MAMRAIGFSPKSVKVGEGTTVFLVGISKVFWLFKKESFSFSAPWCIRTGMRVIRTKTYSCPAPVE